MASIVNTIASVPVSKQEPTGCYKTGQCADSQVSKDAKGIAKVAAQALDKGAIDRKEPIEIKATITPDLIKKQLYNNELLLGDSFERTMLEYLGYRPVLVEQREEMKAQVIQRVMNRVKNEINPSDSLEKQSEILNKIIKEEAEKVRLLFAINKSTQKNLSEEKLPYFIDILRSYQLVHLRVMKETIKILDELLKELENNASIDPYYLNHLFRPRFINFLEEIITKKLLDDLDGRKPFIMGDINRRLDKKTFHENLLLDQELMDQIINNSIDFITHQGARLIDWLSNNNQYLVLPFIQGAEDKQQALVDGVCMGMVHRLVKTLQKNPNMSDEELKEHIRIDSSDRMMQASYKLNRLKYFGKKPFVPDQFAKGYKQEVLFNCSSVDLVYQITTYLNKIQNENGLIKITVDGHILFIQIDKKNKNFRLFDPNFGLFSYPFAEGENSNRILNKVVEMVDAVIELDKAAYNTSKFYGILLETQKADVK